MQLEVGNIEEGKVTGITKFGVFVEFEGGKTGMVHISEISTTYVKEIKDHVTLGQTVKVKVLGITDDGKVSLSIKKTLPMPPKPAGVQSGGYNRGSFDYAPRKTEPATFEDMMSRFKQQSDEKMGELKRSIDSKRGSSSKRSR